MSLSLYCTLNYRARCNIWCARFVWKSALDSNSARSVRLDQTFIYQDMNHSHLKKGKQTDRRVHIKYQLIFGSTAVLHVHHFCRRNRAIADVTVIIVSSTWNFATGRNWSAENLRLNSRQLSIFSSLKGHVSGGCMGIGSSAHNFVLTSKRTTVVCIDSLVSLLLVYVILSPNKDNRRSVCIGSSIFADCESYDQYFSRQYNHSQQHIKSAAEGNWSAEYLPLNICQLHQQLNIPSRYFLRLKSLTRDSHCVIFTHDLIEWWGWASYIVLADLLFPSNIQVFIYKFLLPINCQSAISSQITEQSYLVASGLQALFSVFWQQYGGTHCT